MRFIDQGNDSNIYIPVDFDFKIENSTYRAKEPIDGLGELGGFASLIGSVFAGIQPILTMIFLHRFAVIMLDIYRGDYRKVVIDYITHAL